ncbi:unnamed protein product [Penicillium glandicola]
MPTKYASPTVGRDVDTKWVQWLARRKTPSASPSSSTPVPMPSATLHDSGPLHSRSAATSYFALLSAAQGQQQPRRQGRPQISSPSMDSSWGTWLFDQRPQGSKWPASAGVNPPMQTTSIELQLTSTAPAFAVCSLDSLHFPLTTLMDSESIPGVSDEASGEFDLGLDLDLDLTGQDAELLTWLDEEYSFTMETPVGSGKRSLDSPRELSVNKKQMVDCRSDLGFHVIFRGIVITALPKQEEILHLANCLFYMSNKAGAVVYVIGLEAQNIFKESVR